MMSRNTILFLSAAAAALVLIRGPGAGATCFPLIPGTAPPCRAELMRENCTAVPDNVWPEELAVMFVVKCATAQCCAAEQCTYLEESGAPQDLSLVRLDGALEGEPVHASFNGTGTVCGGFLVYKTEGTLVPGEYKLLDLAFTVKSGILELFQPEPQKAGCAGCALAQDTDARTSWILLAAMMLIVILLRKREPRPGA